MKLISKRKKPDANRTKTGRFRKGVSGNKAGRPKGVQDSRTIFRRAFKESQAEIVDTCIRRALDGDMSAMKLCLDRIVPPLRASSERVVIGIEGTAAEKADKIINELGAGKISTEIAKDFLQVLLTQLDIFESSALCQKVDALEAIIMKRKTP